MRRSKALGGLLAVVMLLGTMGCISAPPAPPTRHYTLGAPLAEPASLPQGDITIGLGPVKLADYLRRPQIVSRVSDNEIALSDFHQWAGSLQEGVTNALASYLDISPSVRLVHTYPWRANFPVDYQVTVTITQFDGALGGEVTMLANWSIYRVKGGGEVTTKRSSFLVTTAGREYTHLVAAHSVCLERLAIEIAEEIASGPENR